MLLESIIPDGWWAIGRCGDQDYLGLKPSQPKLVLGLGLS